MRRATISLLLLSSVAMADVSPYDNYSYLSDTKYTGQSSVDLIDPHKAQQLAQQYDDVTRAYNAKVLSATASIGDQMAYMSSVNEFSKGVISEVKSQQLNAEQNKLGAALKRDQNIMAAAEAGRYPGMVIGGAWALYNGTSYTLRSGSVAWTSSASVKAKTASLLMSSPVFSTNVSASSQNVTTSVSRGIIDNVSMSFINTLQPSANPSNAVCVNYKVAL